MKWLIRIGIGFSVLAAIFVIVGLLLPQDYRVERSITIDADRATVHRLVGDTANWEQWSIWQVHDPSLVLTPGSQTTGPGATLRWEGDQEGSDGRLVFLASDPQLGVTYDLFFQNDQARAQSAMRYSGSDGRTTVTWAMTGDLDTPVLGGYIAPFMDDMIGPMFEEGLLLLESAAENPAP